MTKQIIITTSWDDGHKLDLKLAGLLKDYSIKGTFYVSPENREFGKEEILNDGEIKNLSSDFEIGAHTMSHQILTKLSDTKAFEEITHSKKYLELLTGREVCCFCYPNGKYNEKITGMVERAGFCYSRTMERFRLSRPENFLTSGTALEAHRNSFLTLPVDFFKILSFSRFNVIECFKNLNWEYLAKKTFDYVEKYGGIYHLWGHSWVIERENDWKKLESVFSYITGKKNADYLTNYETFKAVK